MQPMYSLHDKQQLAPCRVVDHFVQRHDVGVLHLLHDHDLPLEVVHGVPTLGARLLLRLGVLQVNLTDRLHHGQNHQNQVWSMDMNNTVQIISQDHS